MQLQDFLVTYQFPGGILFAKLWGSRSHNTHLPDSDYDFSGIYVIPTREILSFKFQPSQETCEQDKEKKGELDFAFHDVGKFCKLLLKGNPQIVENLYTEKHFYAPNKWWGILKEKRRDFLTQTVVNQYVGYADNQLKALNKGTYLHTTRGKYNTKWAYHLIRLLWDARRISLGGEPEVWKEGKEQSLLMDIRYDKWSVEQVKEQAQALTDECKANQSNLPENCADGFLEDWLVDIRKAHL